MSPGRMGMGGPGMQMMPAGMMMGMPMSPGGMTSGTGKSAAVAAASAAAAAAAVLACNAILAPTCFSPPSWLVCRTQHDGPNWHACCAHGHANDAARRRRALPTRGAGRCAALAACGRWLGVTVVGSTSLQLHRSFTPASQQFPGAASLQLN